MNRDDAASRRAVLRATLTGPWGTYQLERVSGLEWKALSPYRQAARDALRGVLESAPRDNGFSGVRFHPDRFVELLRAVLAKAREDTSKSKRRPNIGVLEWALREHAAHALHLHLHHALYWRGAGDARDRNRFMLGELLKAADRLGPVARKAHVAALRIGGKHALDTIVLELSGGVFRPEDGA